MSFSMQPIGGAAIVASEDGNEEEEPLFIDVSEDKNEVTEEFEIMSASVMKDLNNNQYYEYFGPEDWGSAEESN